MFFCVLCKLRTIKQLGSICIVLEVSNTTAYEVLPSQPIKNVVFDESRELLSVCLLTIHIFNLSGNNASLDLGLGEFNIF